MLGVLPVELDSSVTYCELYFDPAYDVKVDPGAPAPPPPVPPLLPPLPPLLPPVVTKVPLTDVQSAASDPVP